VNAAEPGAVLIELYFWRAAAKDGKKSLEHVLSIGDCRYNPLVKPTTLLGRGATLGGWLPPFVPAEGWQPLLRGG
jgi:hypothetical protein